MAKNIPKRTMMETVNLNAAALDAGSKMHLAYLKDAAERGEKTLPVAIPYRGSPGQLHLLIDSTGIQPRRSAASCVCAC